MGGTITRHAVRPAVWQRRAALWSVLASSYSLSRLAVNRAVTGVWDLDLRFMVELLGVTLVQLAVLELLQARRPSSQQAGRVGGEDRHEALP